MKPQSFLIKYGEIGVKGDNRFLFEDALAKQIRIALKSQDGKFTVKREVGRIYVNCESDYEEKDVTEALQRVFGILWICPVVRIPDNGFSDLTKQVLTYIRETYPDSTFTFKVETRRSRKNYPLCSQEINALLGEKILETFPNTKVDVHNPEVVLHIEIREYAINIYSRMIRGAGGLPLGTGGKGTLLLSGGIDSPVAGYMVGKRGVLMEAVYFHAPPYTSERAKEKVIELAKILSCYVGPILLHIIPFTEIEMAIYEHCPHEELTIIMRRYMMRIAEKIALENGSDCLITGESIGQVASQTLQSLRSTNEVCTLPVHRPLIAFDKQDIVDISERIKTYETSILPYEDCCTIFVAKHPVTKPDPVAIRESEKALADIVEPMLTKVYETTEKILCHPKKRI